MDMSDFNAKSRENDGSSPSLTAALSLMEQKTKVAVSKAVEDSFSDVPPGLWEKMSMEIANSLPADELFEKFAQASGSIPPEKKNVFARRMLELGFALEKKIEVEKIVEKPVEVEKIVEVEKPVEVEKIVEVEKPVEKIVERIVVKEVPARIGGISDIGDSAGSELPEMLSNEFGIEKTSNINPANVVEALMQLASFVERMEKLSAGLDKRKSKQADLASLLASVFEGGKMEELQSRLDCCSRSISGIIAGIGTLGKSFAQRFKRRFSPDAIRSIVNMERSSIFKNEDTKCWRKYSEMFSELGEREIDDTLRELLSGYLRNLKG